MRQVKAGETNAQRRRMHFDLRDASDGITPELGEGGGQPEISINDGAWQTVGIGTLVSLGSGRYYAELAETVLVAGSYLTGRYKSAATAETPCRDDIQVTTLDPYDPLTGLNSFLVTEHGGGSWQQAIVSGGQAANPQAAPVATAITAGSGQDFEFSFFVDGMDTTGAYGYSFTIKRSLDDSDSESLVQIMRFRPPAPIGAPTGLVRWKAETIADAGIRAWGSMSYVDGGDLSVSGTTVTVRLNSDAMDIIPSPAGAPYVYQLDVWTESRKRIPMARESFTLERSVTRNVEAPYVAEEF